MNALRKKVFVGMSGGVDSSVAAMMLRDEGYDVTGVFMRCYNIDGCAERDAEDARRVAGVLDIPFYVWDFEEEYKRRVVEYMVNGYRAGITPNPDVMCNKEIKFGLFLRRALEDDADYVATGHYVSLDKAVRRAGRSGGGKSCVAGQTVEQPAVYRLVSARDKNKDQSYFLWTLTQNELSHCLFPIGGYLKSEVRELARHGGLPTAEKKDSQGICFLGMVSIEDFLKQYIPERRGELVTAAGEKIGEHSGASFYTIGQRHINARFDFPKTGGAKERKPFYVSSKDVSSNTVTVAEGDDNPALYSNGASLGEVNFINGPESGEVFARVRYRQPVFRAHLFRGGEGAAYFRLEFGEPQKFVAQGQSAVFYDKDGVMLGGGVIL